MQVGFSYPDLPVSKARDLIKSTVSSHQVTILSGQTGSGKTTQLPKMLLEIGAEGKGQIVHTQPRRVAAREIAARVAKEIGTEVGGEVGYQVRFEEKLGPRTKLKIVTDGILLSEIRRDPLLRRYGAVVIDEAHERSLNIDFLLGFMAKILPRRPDLKLVVTSATIDSEKFKAFFESALGEEVPIISVEGKTYPVEILYEPYGSPEALCETGVFKSQDLDPAQQVARAVVEEVSFDRQGDILVFASGQREIGEFSEAIGKALPSKYREEVEILPLFARLGSKDQKRVFAPHAKRRVVIATNIAETSLTIPGIKYCVDPGTARVSRYSRSSHIQRLPVEEISQDRCDQRAGRCGRESEGIAIRLYSEEDYLSRPRYSEPEILRTDLCQVVLHMLFSGVAGSVEEIEGFRFLDKPNMKDFLSALRELEDLGAVRVERGSIKLTRTGYLMAELPVDVRLARMVVEAEKYGPKILAQVLAIVSFFSVNDIFRESAEDPEKARRMQKMFQDPSSDFLSALNLFYFLFEEGGKSLRKKCAAFFLSYQRAYQWRELFSQLSSTLKQRKTEVGKVRPEDAGEEGAEGEERTRFKWDAERVHLSLLPSLLQNIGRLEEPKDKKDRRISYKGARGIKFEVSPSSALYKKKAEWVAAAYLQDTTRLWARGAGEVKPEWIEASAGRVGKYRYSAPVWSEAAGCAVTKRTLSVYGLDVVQKTVSAKALFPAESRRLLVCALSSGQVKGFAGDGFVKENLKTLDEAEEEAARNRTGFDSSSLEEFYEEALPEEVVDVRSLMDWQKRSPSSKSALRFKVEKKRDEEMYPGFAEVAGISLPLSYAFSPSDPLDGVTVHVPLPALAKMEQKDVPIPPGYRSELTLCALKALPKKIRMQISPLSSAAKEAEEGMAKGGEFFSSLGEFLRGRYGILDPVDWAEVKGKLPPYLVCNISVERWGKRKEVLEVSKDLERLKEKYVPVEEVERAQRVKAEVEGLKKSGKVLEAGKVLEEAGLSKKRDEVILEGLLEKCSIPKERLLGLFSPKERLLLRSLEEPGELCRDLEKKAAQELLPSLPSGEEEFYFAQELLGRRLEAGALEMGKAYLKIAEKRNEVVREASSSPLSMLSTVDEVRTHLSSLSSKEALSKMGPGEAREIPRYLEADLLRLKKARANASRDRQWAAQAAEARKIADRLQGGEKGKEARRMYEEFLVSLWAQELGTKEKVSLERLKKLSS
ncbi:MAG: ATP-dependent RNA helicase HrpA [Aeriscardovia sp.]|nr:ATP-dependent RNA helicase HrpA [Aeriscardovia sp.]